MLSSKIAHSRPSYAAWPLTSGIPPLVRFLCFGMLFSLATALFWRFIVATIVLATRDDRFTHILLIWPISTALIFTDRSVLLEKASSNQWSLLSFVGAPILIGIARGVSKPGLSLFHSPDEQLAAAMSIVVIVWIATFVMCFGRRVARSLLFPLCFLFWIIPIPLFALQKIMQDLQQGSAIATSLLFSAARVPALRNGVLVSIPGLTVEVARECSSIRSSLMLLVTTMVLAHVLLKTSWRKTLLTLSAVPLSVAKNGLRIFTIAMLGTRVDRGFLSGHLHHDGGIVFFLLALFVTGMLLGILRRGERAAAKMVRVRPIANHISTPIIEGSRN